MKIFLRFQNIDQMMGDALHLLRADLGGSDIHAAVNLHRIGGNDFAVYGFRQGNG